MRTLRNADADRSLPPHLGERCSEEVDDGELALPMTALLVDECGQRLRDVRELGFARPACAHRSRVTACGVGVYVDDEVLTEGASSAT